MKNVAGNVQEAIRRFTLMILDMPDPYPGRCKNLRYANTEGPGVPKLLRCWRQDNTNHTCSFVPRSCFVIFPHQFDENGFIPSLITEGEAGHAPLIGRGSCSQPWYWGKDFEEACQVCYRANTENGLSQRDVLEILISSYSAKATEKNKI